MSSGKSADTENVRLPLRREIRGLGFGGGALGNLYREISDGVAFDTLRAAVLNGMSYFDTAPHYGFGLSERRLGQYFNEIQLNTRPIVSSKVGRLLAPVSGKDLGRLRQGFISPEPYESVFDYSYDGIYRSFEESLRRLARDVDVLYVHDLGERTHGPRHSEKLEVFLNDGYLALRELRDQGAVRAIGLGVNEWQVCEQVLSAVEIDMILLAGRYTLLEQTALDSFLPLCERLDIAIVVGGPYNSGILARGERAAAAPMYDYQLAQPDAVLKVGAIEAVCARHGVPLAAAALQFPMAHPAVISVIPGMGNVAEVNDAIRWFSWPIPSEFWLELRAQGLIHERAPVPTASPLA